MAQPPPKPRFSSAHGHLEREKLLPNAPDAAKEEYGNEMDGTHITPRPDNYFMVTVGIGNPEDGAHTYLVKCPSKAPLCDCEVKREIDPAKKKEK